VYPVPGSGMQYFFPQFHPIKKFTKQLERSCSQTVPEHRWAWKGHIGVIWLLTAVALALLSLSEFLFVCFLTWSSRRPVV